MEFITIFVKIIYMNTINHWEIKGFVYWENELSVNGVHCWINVGWHIPLYCHVSDIQKTLALSKYCYIQTFN